MALDLLQSAWQARTTVQTPFIWSENETWRKVFMLVITDLGELDINRNCYERKWLWAETRATTTY